MEISSSDPKSRRLSETSLDMLVLALAASDPISEFPESLSIAASVCRSETTPFTDLGTSRCSFAKKEEEGSSETFISHPNKSASYSEGKRKAIRKRDEYDLEL